LEVAVIFPNAFAAALADGKDYIYSPLREY